MSAAGLMGVLTGTLALVEFWMVIALWYIAKWLRVMWRELKVIVDDLSAPLCHPPADTTALSNVLNSLKDLTVPGMDLDDVR